MADKWYYVQKGNRHGPVAFEVIVQLVENKDLGTEEFVWKKGFETWKKIKEVEELQMSKKFEVEEVLPPEMNVLLNEVSLKELSPEERNLYVRIGADRGSSTTEYGPFSLKQVQKLFKENRINGKTFLFIKGTNNWKMLADFKDYEEVFEEVPPVIKESERRVAVRKPFIARIFFNNDKKFYEGICRDISVGGMQILVDGFNGNVGDKISMNVHPENSDYHFAASGVVLRLLEGNSGLSFRFQNLSGEARLAIEKYIQEN
jgi:hypothetical protein